MRISYSCRSALLARARDELVRLEVLDPQELECDFPDRDKGRHVVRVTLEGDISALIYLSRCYRDEWIISIAIQPQPEAEKHMAGRRANQRAGEVFAWGWVNRWQNKERVLAFERFSDHAGYTSLEGKKILASLGAL